MTIDKTTLRVGLGEKLQPGQWTPVRVSLNNPLSRPVTVRVELLVPDADQDIARYQRLVTLTPQRADQQTWLYAVAPIDSTDQTQWRLQVIQDDTGQLLDHHDLALGARVLDPRITATGVLGQATMGLEPYASDITHQQAAHFLRGLEPTTLPDRWHGLSMLSTMIWTPRLNPTDAATPPEFFRAIRQWVQRGGHLVIILPIAGDTWGQSPLADLLPPVGSQIVHDVLPLFLGTISRLPSAEQHISLRVFTPPIVTGTQEARLSQTTEASWGRVTPVLSHEGRPWVVAHQVGVGRVTLIGVDLTDPRLVQMGLPSSGRWTLWNDILGWRGPALTRSYLQTEIDAGRINRPELRSAVQVDDFIRQHILMSDTAGKAMWLTIGLFSVYWLLAGPFSGSVLKRWKRQSHSWNTFVFIALAMTLIAWGSAWLMKPTHTAARHLSVLTATMGQPGAHVHAWLSLYVPSHGLVDVALLGSDDAPLPTRAGGDVLWSAALVEPGQSSSAFPDRRQYAVTAAGPDRVALPFRSTARELELDYLGDLPALSPSSADEDAQAHDWLPPTGSMRVVDGWPVGHLTHRLPGSLKHVAVIYSDGTRLANGQLREPFYWLYRDPWPTGRPLMFAGRPANAQLLTQGADAQWTGRLADLTRRLSNDSMNERVEILSLYDMLPPPDYRDMSFTSPVRVYRRLAGRALDLTPLARLRGMIILAHLTDVPLPAPLHVQGDTPESTGDVLIRWIIPLPPPGSVPGILGSSPGNNHGE